ncbi:protease [Pseudoalteromonas ruthenica]|uniref:beta-barrel assembly-enhancing protease n=1 Tax=Pseudoalteromonas ruthenica TaxID=151081 RepID=UPI00110872E0|nr:M48 family metalloprotease [Pseudoalteromonas ruthenica]TLX49963.1 protease [Pseudoalteromonas ruthenica]
MPFKRILLSCALVSTTFMPVKAQNTFELPDLGTSALQVLPIEKERAIGDVMMMQIRGSSPVIDDPVLDEYLTTLGNKLVSHADDVRFPFSFFWINNKDINAFAFYGGHVGVHTGLIAQADNESQLASVLGHEIAHVTQRHLARRLQQQKDNSGVTIAGLIAGILATVVAPDAGMAIISGTQTQSALSQLSHSRGAEQEADRIGMRTLYEAGFDPHASGEFLTKLAAQIRYRQKPPVFILTHPLPQSRISDVRLRAQQYEKRQYGQSLEFYLAKSRILARYGYDSQQAQEQFNKLLRENAYGDKSALHYGLALTLIDQKKFDQAWQYLAPLLERAPSNLFYLDTLTDYYVGKGEPDKALEHLRPFHQLRPNNQVITLNYAHAAIEAEDYVLATELLRSFTLEKPDHFLAKQLLTTTYRRQDDKAAYHEANADLMAQVGAYMKAADEVQKALNHIEPNEAIKHKRLKALLGQYRQMQKELARL